MLQDIQKLWATLASGKTVHPQPRPVLAITESITWGIINDLRRRRGKFSSHRREKRKRQHTGNILYLQKMGLDCRSIQYHSYIPRSKRYSQWNCFTFSTHPTAQLCKKYLLLMLIHLTVCLQVETERSKDSWELPSQSSAWRADEEHVCMHQPVGWVSHTQEVCK